MSKPDTVSARVDREVWDLIVWACQGRGAEVAREPQSRRNISAAEIRGVGISADAVSWLLKLGFLNFAASGKLPAHEPGQAEHLLAEPAAFLPTDAGYALAQRLRQDPHDWPAIIQIIANQSHRPQSQTPDWDSERLRLSVRGAPVLKLSSSSFRMRSILDAFQEESWPPRIDDPLPPTGNADPAHKLRDTVYRLNRRLSASPLSFQTVNAGTAVCWLLDYSQHPQS